MSADRIEGKRPNVPGSLDQAQVTLMQRPLRRAAEHALLLSGRRWELDMAAQAARTIVGTNAMVLPAARCALLKLRMSAPSCKRAGGGTILSKAYVQDQVRTTLLSSNKVGSSSLVTEASSPGVQTLCT